MIQELQTFAVVEVDAAAQWGFGQRQRRLLGGQIQEVVLHKQTHHGVVPRQPGLRRQAERNHLHPDSLTQLKTKHRFTESG